jgi:hypothetical protein
VHPTKTYISVDWWMMKESELVHTTFYPNHQTEPFSENAEELVVGNLVKVEQILLYLLYVNFNKHIFLIRKEYNFTKLWDVLISYLGVGMRL